MLVRQFQFQLNCKKSNSAWSSLLG